MLIQTLTALWVAGTIAAPAAHAQPYRSTRARRHFVSVHVERQIVHPHSFARHPLEELLGRPVSEVNLQPFQYRTRDGQTEVTVLDYGKRADGVGLTVYPLGSSEGVTLAVRGSVESVPNIRVAFAGPAPQPTYELTGGRATDVALGLDMSDRSAGWGVGAHAFVLGGVGRVTTDQRDGRRYFGEGGGGVTFGPFGVDLAVKYAVNRFDLPVAHAVHMLPISVRGTLTF